MMLSYPEPADQQIIDAYKHFINDASYPCLAAKAAMTKGNLRFYVADDLNDTSSDNSIIDFLYTFVDEYRIANDLYHSATVLFRNAEIDSEEQFDKLLWKKLQSLSDIDAQQNNYDPRVSSNPESTSFSFSLRGEAFYIIGLHPHSSRAARRFEFAAMVFNPHAQFEMLRLMMKYEVMKGVVRKREIIYSGSINPMLEDFGNKSEVYQYSGRNYNQDWKCPLKIRHGSVDHHTSA